MSWVFSELAPFWAMGFFEERGVREGKVHLSNYMNWLKGKSSICYFHVLEERSSEKAKNSTLIVFKR